VYHGSTLLACASALHEALAVEAAKPRDAREPPFRPRNVGFLAARLAKRLIDLHPPHEAALLKRAADAAGPTLLAAAAAAAKAGESAAAAKDAVATALAAVRLAADGVAGGALPAWTSLDAAGLAVLLDPPPPPPPPVGEEEAAAAAAAGAPAAAPAAVLPSDAFLGLAAAVFELRAGHRDASRALLAERDEALATLLARQQAHATSRAAGPGAGAGATAAGADGAPEPFYPDANGCLRLSAGFVEGYGAADAVRHLPRTTLAGLLDKHAEAALGRGGGDGRGGELYACPEKLLGLCRGDPAATATPVCVLYRCASGCPPKV